MLKRLLPQTGFARNVLTLFTGASIAQAIPILISPILTRLYPVSEFAVLTLITTLISLLGVIVCGRYEVAIGLPSDENEAKQLVYLSILISISVSTVAMVLVLFFNESIADLLNNHNAASYILFVPLISLMYGLNQALTYWNIRKRNYYLISRTRVGQSVSNSLTSLSLGYSIFRINGLVIGNMLGHLSILILTYFGTKGRAEISFSKNDLNIEKLKHLARKYSDLPLVNGLHAFTDMLQVTGVIFVISAVFESVTTGLYGLTMRILQAPLTMIGTSFSIVFYKEASEKVANNQKITKLLRTTILTLAAISFPVFLVIMIIGPDLFAFVFGESWRDAGVYARILSPYLFMNFISSPVSHLPVILNKQREFFLLSLVGNILVLAGILIGAFVYSDFQIGLIIVSISQVLYTGFVLYYFYSISRNYND